MTKRLSQLRAQLRDAQQQLPALLEECFGREPLLPGSLYVLRRKCGKPNCHCTRGELHESTVLSYRGDGTATQRVAGQRPARHATQDERTAIDASARPVPNWSAGNGRLLTLVDAIEGGTRPTGRSRVSERAFPGFSKTPFLKELNAWTSSSSKTTSRYVIDEFREGRFDYIELASDVAETKFFEFLFGRQIVERLAQHYPSPRERHHVPLWFYLSSQLSLRLHGQHSFHSYPLIIRAGGLIDALGPEVARREVDPQSGDVKLECEGFNDRNQHPRKTPCDQDFLRKLARDTKPDELEDWYNRHAAAMYQELGAFDGEGLFIADGTYLFVPDNPRYEGSQRLLFDEHNHPVSKKQEQEMTKAERSRCRWRRHYKAVLLSALRRGGRAFRGGWRACVA